MHNTRREEARRDFPPHPCALRAKAVTTPTSRMLGVDAPPPIRSGKTKFSRRASGSSLTGLNSQTAASVSNILSEQPASCFTAKSIGDGPAAQQGR